MTIALTRLAQRNLSKAKGVGGGVLEYKIDFGPGYRFYFGKDEERLVILISGGTKKRQDEDIAGLVAASLVGRCKIPSRKLSAYCIPTL